VQSTISKFDSKLPFYVLNLDIFENDMSRFVLKSSFKTDTFAVLYKYITKKNSSQNFILGTMPMSKSLVTG
jgi:hypothetical protein